jgi:prepilin-type N-terminal cleavage/methylation domain-containing protein
MRKMGKLSTESGFSIIELLTVIGIIGIIAAIAIPQYTLYRNRGFIARAETDLRNFAIAEEAYMVDHEVYKSCSNSGCSTTLEGVNSLSAAITLEITATTTGFTGTSTHPAVSVTCRWDSSNVGFLGCS